MKKSKTKDAVELIDQWYGGDEDWNRMVLEEELKARIGQVVYALRSEAGLTQTRLAKMIGTNQAIISRVENGDYSGSALEILWRVCFALHKRLHVGYAEMASQQPGCHIGVASA